MTSITYPNVLAMDYLKAVGQLTPETGMKCEQAINLGYQGLLTFQTSGGGFAWFSRGEPQTVLTAYGIFEMSDMNKVYPIDTSVIARAVDWILKRQNRDGSWEPEGLPHYWQTTPAGKVGATAYVLWALSEAGVEKSRLAKAREFVANHTGEAKDSYMMALCANALISYDANDAAGRALCAELENTAIVSGDTAMWNSTGTGWSHSRGETVGVEATGMAALALMRARGNPIIIIKALTTLIRARDGQGSWGSTQSTILAMKALLEASRSPLGGVKGTATARISVNGQDAGTMTFTEQNADVLQQTNLSRFLTRGENIVAIEMDGEASLTYQMTQRHYMPWNGAKPSAQKSGPLTLDVTYDKTTVAVNENIRCDVRMTYSGAQATFMVIVTAGIPPGFGVEEGDLQKLVEQKRIEKYSLTGRQVQIYLGDVKPNEPVKFSFGMRAKYPVRAQAPSSEAYEYYTPENRATAKPVEINVGE
jgi:uncharacterized protein YfaS (alpha-2-macroglobulin family)